MSFSIDAFREAASGIPIHVPFLWAITTGLSMRDAYMRADSVDTRTTARDDPETTMRCPHCREQLEDPNLDFCQWCAEPLDEPVEDDSRFSLTSR